CVGVFCFVFLGCFGFFVCLFLWWCCWFLFVFFFFLFFCFCFCLFFVFFFCCVWFFLSLVLGPSCWLWASVAWCI
ncbi:hypothetical protein RA269_29115, partial [Pseudomonas syringae pv. tagetis]|uniref:hypothetical protein n=1 Tax=Pseudomonas syringae group genomosp. 7 TaxID=251699 RepID=UPI00376FCF7B